MNPANLDREEHKAWSNLMGNLGREELERHTAITLMINEGNWEENGWDRAEELLEKLNDAENIPVKSEDGKVRRTDLDI